MTYASNNTPEGYITSSGTRSIAAGAITGLAITGDAHLTVLSPEALTPVESLNAPPRLTNIPPRNRLFVGREREIEQLNLEVNSQYAPRITVIHGLGGIGKSTLVANWAVDVTHKPAWWIAADSQTSIRAGLAEFACALQPSIANSLPQQALTERAISWLSSHENWLLVLDNVTDPSDINLITSRVKHGLIVVTSRRTTGWHHVDSDIALEALSTSEAKDLFAAIVNPKSKQSDVAITKLCAELGELPLAVEQAGAFCAESGISADEYLELLATHPAATYRNGPEGTHADRTVARVWNITLDRLADDPVSTLLLHVLCWYAPNSIPRSLVDKVSDAPALTKARGRLAAHSMISIDPESQSINLHRLVQAVGRTPDPMDQYRSKNLIASARSIALRHLKLALSGDLLEPGNWPSWRAIIPHVSHLADYSSPSEDCEVLCSVLSSAGMFLVNQGQFGEARRLLERSITGFSRLFGSVDVRTLQARITLGAALISLDGPAKTLPYVNRVLKDAEKYLGNDHEATLSSRNNVAYAYMWTGQPKRAIPLLKETIASRERTGDEGLEILVCRLNLARAYRDLKDFDTSLTITTSILDEAITTIGEDHPFIISIESALGGIYHETREHRKALDIQKKCLRDSEKLLGKSHPETLAAQNNLAASYSMIGNERRGLKLTEKTLKDRERVLGYLHPDTILTRNNFAAALLQTGNRTVAKHLFIQNLAECKDVLGPNHPLTRATETVLSLLR
ncbi:tetratricopeptide repeat protein [Streptomyces venezuelae]|nr:tetratricopeptide repeat protein [Streptomyces venezuelae]